MKGKGGDMYEMKKSVKLLVKVHVTTRSPWKAVDHSVCYTSQVVSGTKLIRVNV